MTERWTILHTEASNGWGGQEIRILTEARWMRNRGHRVVIAGPGNGRLFQKAREEGFETAAVPFEKGTQAGDLFRVMGLLKRLRPDVVATHSSVDSWVGLAAARLRGIPCAVRYRHVSTPVKNSAANRFLYRKLCDRIITTSETTSRCLRNDFRLPDGRVKTIATGVAGPGELPAREDARRRLCGELGLDGDARFIGCVAVLRSWKGHRFLMDAFEIVADSHPDVHLVLVGDGPIRKTLLEKREKAACPERIHLVGHRDDPWPYYRGMETIVLASVKNEGIPQSLLQSMLAGTPVIGTNVGGIPEIVSPGRTGLLVEPGDPRQLAEAVAGLLDGAFDKSRIVSQARQMVEECYSLDRMGEQVCSVFQEVLKDK